MSLFKTDMQSRSFWDWLCGRDNQVQLDAAAKAYVPKDYEASSSETMVKIIFLNERDEKVDAALKFTASVHDSSIYGIMITPGEHYFKKWLKENAASGLVEIEGFENKTKEFIPAERVLKIEAKNVVVKLRYRK